MGAAKDLIAKAKARATAPVFDKATLAEVSQLVEHNRTARKRDKVSAEDAIKALGLSLSRCTFDRAVKQTLGCTFGGGK
jgi:hypothetical protein